MGWKDIVSKVAPVIGTALGGPFGGIAAAAVCKAFDLPAGSKDDDIEAQLSKYPDKLLELRKAEIDFKEKMAQHGVEIERVHADDRSSAREREKSVKDRMPALLSFVVLAGFLATLAWMLAYGLPETGGEALLVMLGTLGGAFGSIVSYYFGSSSGSAQKNDLMASMRK